MEKKKFSFKDTARVSRMEWAIFIAACVLLLFTNAYADIRETSSNGIFVWKSLFSGDLFNYYYTAPCTVDYPFTVYLSFAFVNLPIYLLSLIFGFVPDGTWWYLAYNKLFICGFFLITMLLFRRICEKLEFDEKATSWATFVYATSAIVVYTIPVVGQYDILAVLFSFLGILSLFDGKRRNFLLWFSLALTYKYLAVFALIPLLLLSQKKFIKLFLELAATLVPTLLLMRGGLLFAADDAVSRGPMMLYGYFNTPDLYLGLVNFSFFTAAMLVMCIFCYVKPFDNSGHARRNAIYGCALSYAALFLFTVSHSYWYIMLAPFLCMILFFNPKQFKLSLMIETVASTAIVLVFESFVFIWCTGYHAFAASFAGQLMGLSTAISYPHSQSVVNTMLSVLRLDAMQPMAEQVLGTVFVVGVAAILCLNYPREKIKPQGIQIERSAMWLRVACSLAVGILPALNIMMGILTLGL